MKGLPNQAGPDTGDDHRGPRTSLDDAAVERFSRQILLPEIGPQGQQRLLACRALFAGLDPALATAAVYLAGAGIELIGLADAASVGPTDLDAPLVFYQAALGRPRTIVTAEKIRRLNPGTRTLVVDSPAKALASGKWDLVLCTDADGGCVDACNSACIAAAIPLLVIHVEASCAWLVIVAGPAMAIPCWSCVAGTCHSQPRNDDPGCTPIGLGSICAGIIGTLAATESIKLLLALPGARPGLLVTYAPAVGSLLARSLSKDPRCNVCGRLAAVDVEAGD